MKILRHEMILVTAFALVGALGMRTTARADAGVLYIGDAGDNTVKCFDLDQDNPPHCPDQSPAQTVVTGLDGPRGLLFLGSTLLVNNQNLFTPGERVLWGEIWRYNTVTGELLPPLVASTQRKNAPAAPHGMVMRDYGTRKVLYVVDPSSANGISPGALLWYDATTGEPLGRLGVEDISSHVPKNKDFHPIAVVFGADDLLYLSVRDLPGLGGHVLRFTPESDGSLSFKDVFVADDGGVGQLNRPHALVIGRYGCVYVTSFRADTTDTDSIRIYNPDPLVKPGERFTGKIDLYDPGTKRAYGNAILFGPDTEEGPQLYVPISGGDPAHAGQVRRYTVETNEHCELIQTPDPDDYDEIVPAHDAGGSLLIPWFLIFSKSDPTTLQYNE